MRTSIYRRQRTNFSALLSIGALLLLWKIAALRVGKEIILPGPEIVAQTIIKMLLGPTFWRHLGATVFRGLLGFSFSYLSGLIFGIICGLGPSFDTAFRPLLVILRSTPSMALIVMALIWFKSDTVTLFVTFLMVFPLVTQNVIEGVRGVDPQLKEMARVYQVRSSRLLRELYLPSIVPYLAAGATAGLGVAWKVMVAAEVLAAPRWGIGVQMDSARIFLDTPEVMAWTAVLICLGYLCDRLLDQAIKKRLLFWK